MAQVATVKCHRCGRNIVIEHGPTLAAPDPDRVQVQLRCKYADGGHYDVYPFFGR
jgi:hypothetical protein